MKHITSTQSRSTLSNVENKDVQPNAVDLKLGKVFKISENDFFIDEDRKQHRGSEPVNPDSDGYYHLDPGHYEVIMENIIDVGDHEAGWVITRSTLNRNGVFITSGLYDSGYNGVMAGVMHVNCGRAIIKQGTRIGQYLNFEAEMLSKYDGDYGLNKQHDEKYGV